MNIEKLKELVEKTRQASVALACLAELPGYNGSILTIDDDEAEDISKNLSDAAFEFGAVIALLESKTDQGVK